ncbi:winged helix-turn-helix domain-containing protein [Streptomyces sp. ISID311]|uniref:winged helix-turn-helix domain-containing protein n=1 Tax=Streptomyces sp. ISID311 TaxID=2601673 RepID=UPI0011BD3318|nr:winged helix-turn-helix domain-containing protein [Streptomyces sp. ISID311]TXC99454.1 winged helix-turn-helix transcriptional regulator [Streptomyces sp. ISID311]
MTTALPAQAAPSGSPLPDMRHLRLVGDTAQDGGEGLGSAPLVGYLVLVPEGTDPAQLFAKDVTRPEIRPVAYRDSPPAQQTGGDAVRVDAARHVAELDGRELDLTYLEFALLAHLVRYPHQVHSREQLMVGIWGYDHIGDGRTVDVHIARLRRKLGTAHRHRIVTVRRVGYKYVPDHHESPAPAPCH